MTQETGAVSGERAVAEKAGKQRSKDWRRRRRSEETRWNGIMNVGSQTELESDRQLVQ